MTEPRPPRRSLFAVWRWPRWTWVILVILLPLAYLLSAAPMFYVISRTDRCPAVVVSTFKIVYRPVLLAHQQNGNVTAIFDWELDTLSSLFGQWGVLWGHQPGDFEDTSAASQNVED